MNTYYKFCPNVFLAKCDEKHEKGEIIEVTTKYGKENESIVFNLIFEKDGFYYYSIVRADGFNVQEWRSKELNAGVNGHHRQRKRVMSSSIVRTKIEISFLLESQSRSGTIVKNGIEKRLMTLGTIWAKVLSSATRLPNMRERRNIGRAGRHYQSFNA